MPRKILAALALMLSLASAFPGDIVRELPDCMSFNYNVYSGYLTVTQTKSLHYIFVHSMDDPVTDPVVIWFNGGPGSSSLIGFFQEHGPCIIDDGETRIKENPYPWNMRANTLYIESPAGVGFSYASTTQDHKTNDLIQSQDLLKALDQFFKKFPEFLANDLYITGESYGGIYVPYLAWQIYQNNLNAEFDTTLTSYNLKGYAVGNGATNFTLDVWPAYIETVYKFHLIPKEMYDRWHEHNCFFSFQHALSEDRPLVCDEIFGEIEALTSGLNWYDLYRHVYSSSGVVLNTPENRMGTTTLKGETLHYRRGYTMEEYTPWLKGVPGADKVLLGAYLSDYCNREDVREALNIPDSIGTWTESSVLLQYHIQPEASIWIYKVLRNKIKIMHYSGDTDGAVPTYGTRSWIKTLGWDITEKWRYWTTDGQISGYIERYDGLDFVTVHGVGHMAPQWKRKDVTSMISAWIHDEPIEEF